MKKLFVISLLLLALVLTVAACKTDNRPADDTTVAETTGAEEPTAAPTEPENTTSVEEPTDAPETTAAPETTKEPETTKKPLVEKPTEPQETEPVTEPDPTAPVAVFDADALNNLTGQNGISSIERVDNYLHIVPESNDPYYYPMGAPANITGGRYVAIKYRTDNAKDMAMQIYIGSGTLDNDNDMLKQPIVGDGEWHVAIFDAMQVNGQSGDLTGAVGDPGSYDGSTVAFFRFDAMECDYILDENGLAQKDANGVWMRSTLPEGAYIDVEYVAFFNSFDAAMLYENRPVHLVTPEYLDGMLLTSANTTEGTLQDGYITLKGVGGDGWIMAYNGENGSLSSMIALIRYRTTDGTSGEFFAGSGGGPTAGSERVFSYEADGKWHSLITDLSGLSDMTEDGIKYIRYDYFLDATGLSIDIAYIALFDTVAEAEAYTAIMSKVPEDTHNFRSDAQATYDAVGADVNLQDSDLAQFGPVTFGDGQPVYLTKNAEGVYYYDMPGNKFTSVIATTDGAYAFTVDVLTTAGGAEGFSSVIFRGVQNASPEQQFFGQDGHDAGGVSMGGAGIYLNPVEKEDGLYLRINVKTYDGGYVPNITTVPVSSKVITVVDNGELVSVMAGDELVATFKISGNKDYELPGVSADDLAATAVMTLADGTVVTYENACVAASHLSNVGVATRTGVLKFTAISLMPYSSVTVPAFDTSPMTTDKTAYTLGDPIMITARGSGKDWVGIANRGADTSIGWYYVESVSGKAVNFYDCATDGMGGTVASLPIGEYTVYLIGNDANLAGSIPIAAIDITIEAPNYHKLPVWNGPEGNLTHISHDVTRWENGSKAGTAVDYSDTNVGDSTEILYAGWVGSAKEIASFGYQLGDSEAVWNDEWKGGAEDAVQNAAASTGAAYANRFYIRADVSAVVGTQTVSFLYKAADGSVVALSRFSVTKPAPIPADSAVEGATYTIVADGMLGLPADYAPAQTNKNLFANAFMEGVAKEQDGDVIYAHYPLPAGCAEPRVLFKRKYSGFAADPHMVIRYRTNVNVAGRIHAGYEAGDGEGAVPIQDINWIADGEWQTASVDLAAFPGIALDENGKISVLNLVLLSGTAGADCYFDIDYIAFYAN